MRNPQAIHPATLPHRRSPWQSEAEEQAVRQEGTEAELEVLLALLPGIFARFAAIKDPRRPGSVRHKAVIVLTFGLLMSLYQIASRREANRALTQPTFWRNLQAVFPELDTVPHADTVGRFLEAVPAAALQDVLIGTLRKLMRGGKLRSWLAREGYVLAIDGTQKWASDRAFAPEALRRKTGLDRMTYQVYVLEAVLVGAHGVSLPVLFEFCANDSVDAQTKQDSEQKAFRRLAQRLKQAFPRTHFVVALDGLYPNGPIMTLCRAYRWDFMIVLPDESLRTVWLEANGLHRLSPENRRNYRWGDRDQSYWWVNGIEYTWEDAEGHYHHMKLHVVVCEETWNDERGAHASRWAWLSSVPLTKQNVVHRCNQIARRRWDIEGNLLVEKRCGYHYEHLYSYDWNALQGWHALFRLGHLLTTLSLHSVNLWPIYRQYGLQATLRWLRETMIAPWLDRRQLALLRRKPPQLRLIL